ncbi:hypothetical protein K438DRAFT_1970905 [Mycena galopus ATCC 62051]|nr:hypothetical protein K438DRAFT_1970905 [Mycena galopus ATCC 62051]
MPNQYRVPPNSQYSAIESRDFAQYPTPNQYAEPPNPQYQYGSPNNQFPPQAYRPLTQDLGRSQTLPGTNPQVHSTQNGGRVPQYAIAPPGSQVNPIRAPSLQHTVSAPTPDSEHPRDARGAQPEAMGIPRPRPPPSDSPRYSSNVSSSPEENAPSWSRSRPASMMEFPSSSQNPSWPPQTPNAVGVRVQAQTRKKQIHQDRCPVPVVSPVAPLPMHIRAGLLNRRVDLIRSDGPGTTCPEHIPAACAIISEPISTSSEHVANYIIPTSIFAPCATSESKHPVPLFTCCDAACAITSQPIFTSSEHVTNYFIPTSIFAPCATSESKHPVPLFTCCDAACAITSNGPVPTTSCEHIENYIPTSLSAPCITPELRRPLPLSPILQI